MTPFEVFEIHTDACAACEPFRLCEIGQLLLERASSRVAERLAPMPSGVVVIDLPGHIAKCTACTPRALCVDGQQIADEQGTALIATGVRRKAGERKC